MTQPDQEQQLLARIQDAYSIAETASSQGVIPYLSQVVIDSRPEPMPFRSAAEPWQWALANKLAGPFEALAGVRKNYTGKRRLWLTLSKGSDKTSMIARLSAWALAFAKMPFHAYVCAKDREQAGYLLDAMINEARLNPWLHKRLDFRNFKVLGPQNSTLTIMPADGAGSQGIRGDLIICDELTAWANDDLFVNIVSGISKRPTCVFLIITNAGVKFTWSWDALNAAKASKLWYVYEAPGRLASWMSEEHIKEDRKLLTKAMAARLYDNVWVPPGDGDGFVTHEEALKCEEIGHKLGLLPRYEGKPGVAYVGAIDYGPVKDRTVLTVLHREPNQVVTVDVMEVWQGSRECPVKIEAVERWVESVKDRFNLEALVVDMYQMESTFQKYSGVVPLVKWEPRGGRANYEMAQNLRALVVNEQLAWYKGCGDINSHSVADEMSELFVKPMGYGWRMEHLPSKHDDRTVALAMAALQLVKMETKRNLYMGDNFF